MTQGAGSLQDLHETAFHRVLTVMKSLDLVAANRADLQGLISQGLTTKVRAYSRSQEPGGGGSLTLLASGVALVRGSASCDHL